MIDTLIRNVTVIDGTGAPAYRGDVGIKAGKLTFINEPAANTVDGTGLTLMPGFIDVHSHGDLVHNDFSALSKLSQGITTEVAGQCGVSIWGGADAETQKKFASGICPYPELPPESCRRDYAAYLDCIDSTSRLNMAVFVGHGALRLATMGYESAAPSMEQTQSMRHALENAMEAGALGLSTGLVYTPDRYSSAQELISLLSVVKKYGGTYVTHVRDESDRVVEAEREAVYIARSAGVPLWISHLKAAGRQNWGKPAQILELFDKAKAEGLQISVDCYPYLAGMTALNVSIPPRFMAGGAQALTERLSDKTVLAAIRDEILRPSDYDNYILNSGGFSGVMVGSCPYFHGAEGMTVSEYAESVHMEPFDAYIDILHKNKGLGLGIYFHMSEDDLLNIAAYPDTMVGTDGLLGKPGENGHPRAFGSFPRAIGLYVREKKLFSIEELVRRVSGMAAERLGLRHKGLIREGYDADVVLADMDNFRDTADYHNSNTLTEGIRAVYVNGHIAYEFNALTGGFFGRAVRRA